MDNRLPSEKFRPPRPAGSRAMAIGRQAALWFLGAYLVVVALGLGLWLHTLWGG